MYIQVISSEYYTTDVDIYEIISSVSDFIEEVCMDHMTNSGPTMPSFDMT